MGLATLLILAVIAGCLAMAFARRPSRGGVPAPPTDASDAEAEARRWVDRLGAGVANLTPGGNTAAAQALADAAERYNAASVELAQARSTKQFWLVSQTAIEGLHYIRAARTALDLDPGPELPRLGDEIVDRQRRVVVDGREYTASPRPGDATPYYYPGGMVGGRSVPAGWYSTPWWKTALVAGAAGLGGMLLADTLLGGFGFGGHHHGGPGFGDWGGFGGPGGPF